MEKVILVYESRPNEEFKTEALLTHLVDSVVSKVHGLTVHVRNLGLPRDFLSAGGFDSSVGFALAIWIDTYEELSAFEGQFATFGVPSAGYAVTESVAREYTTINWNTGARSPGVTLFAQLRRRAGLSPGDFEQRWREHSKLSLRLHPLTRYYRNFVQRRLWGTGPEWDAIVEERVGSIEDLLPERFYPDEAAQSLAVQDLERFVDITRNDMRCALLEEYVLRRPPWLLSV